MRMRWVGWLLLLPAVALALTFNSQGTAKVPISVTTAAKVLPGNSARRSWCVFAEGTDIRCNVGGINDAAPGTAPSSTAGFLIKANLLACVNAGSNSNVPASVDPQQRLDCASTSGSAVSVDTSETP